MCFVTEVKTTRCPFSLVSLMILTQNCVQGLWEKGVDGPNGPGRNIKSLVLSASILLYSAFTWVISFAPHCKGHEAGSLNRYRNWGSEMLTPWPRSRGWRQIQKCENRTRTLVFLISIPVLITTTIEHLSRKQLAILKNSLKKGSFLLIEKFCT